MQDVESGSHTVLLLRSATADPEKEKRKFLCEQLGRKHRWVPRRVFFGALCSSAGSEDEEENKNVVGMLLQNILYIFVCTFFFFPSRIKSKSLLDFPVSGIITVEHGSKIKVLCVGH